MSEARFTSRSWELTTEPDSEHYCVTVDCGGVMKVSIITSATDITFTESFERIANAHLIAAAPKMYEMLESLAEQDECQMFKCLINKLLAEARGEQ